MNYVAEMGHLIRTSDPESWIAEVFSAKAVAAGGVIRRHSGWVEREIGRARFVDEVRARGFHLLETGDHFIVVCHGGPVRMLF